MVLSHRKGSLVALTFALAAVTAQLLAHRHATLGMVAVARATAEGLAEPLGPVASWHSRRSGDWGIIGLVSALLAAGCWAWARWAGETIPSGSLAALLMAYLTLILLVA